MGMQEPQAGQQKKTPQSCTQEGITPCTNAGWKADQLGCIRQNIAIMPSKVIFPLFLPMVRLMWSAVSNSGLPGAGETALYWRKSNKEQWNALRITVSLEEAERSGFV